MLDADRESDRRAENADLLTDFDWNTGVGHACRQAGKRLLSAEAHRKLEDLQRVKKSGCCRLAADNVELMSSPSPDIVVRTNDRRANLCRDERGNEPSQPYGPVLHRPF